MEFVRQTGIDRKTKTGTHGVCETDRQTDRDR